MSLAPKIFPIIETLIKLHFKKIQVQIKVYNETDISDMSNS